MGNEMASGLINMAILKKAAEDLYDNRLGDRPDNPCPHAPRHFWDKLREALEPFK